jgi:DNA-binding MarR family transcriptional regulator
MSELTLRPPALFVLTALAAEPQHGYAVIQDVLRISDRRLRLHMRSLYTILDRLQKGGLIEVDHEEIVASRLRRYYRLTGAGAARLAGETEAARRHACADSSRPARVCRGPSEASPRTPFSTCTSSLGWAGPRAPRSAGVDGRTSVVANRRYPAQPRAGKVTDRTMPSVRSQDAPMDGRLLLRPCRG